MNRCPKWVQKWRELERLVDRKYESYISIVGLQLNQFNEASLRRFWVILTIRKYEFLIGRGMSRLDTVNMAINTLKHNTELKHLITIFTARLASENEIADELRIIKECQLETNPQP